MKLITWNVQWFCGIDDVVSVERVVNEAQAFAGPGGFDVICMQEVAVNYPGLPGGAAFDQPAALRELLPGYQVFFGAAVDEFTAAGRQQFGNLIATRLPVLQMQHHALPYPADATPGGVRSMPRMATCVTVQDPALGPLRLYSTHLEFYSRPQRMAQLEALRGLHAQACAQAAHPPAHDATGWPFQNKIHTTQAIFCGDWNFEPHSVEYERFQVPFSPDAGMNRSFVATNSVASRLMDAWPVVHSDSPHEPSFRLFDRRYGPVPITCDFAFVSEGLAPRVRQVVTQLETTASDHQPVLVELS